MASGKSIFYVLHKGHHETLSDGKIHFVFKITNEDNKTAFLDTGSEDVTV